jgi:hypothetical protein
MKTARLLLTGILCLLASASLFSQSPTKVWDKAIGGSDFDFLDVMYPLADGGYLLAGNSHSNISGDKSEANRGTTSYGDYWIVKIDASGNKVWDKTIGGTGDEYVHSITSTTDGGYLLLGGSWSPVSGDKTVGSRGGNDFWLVKIDASGNKVWDKVYGGSSDDEGFKIVPTADGNYLLGGTSASDIGFEKSSNSYGSNDFWLIKIDPSGNKIWDKVYGGSWADEMYEIIVLTDGFLLAGSSASMISGNKTVAPQGGRDYWMVKTDLSGTKLSEYVFGGSGEDVLSSFIATADGYILAGTSVSPVSGDKTEANRGVEDYWVVKTNASGVKQWDKTLGGSGVDELNTALLNADGTIMLGGSSRSGITGDKTQTNRGWEDYWLVGLSSTGSKNYDLTLGGSGQDEMYAMATTTDGGWLLGGFSESSINGDKTTASKGSYDYWMVKLTSPAFITLGTITGTSFCAGQQVSIPYTITGTFNAGNVFTAELSDNTGSFSSPITIGSNTSTTAGTITATLPSGLFQGSQYRIRMRSSNPATVTADNGTNLTINALPTITAVANQDVCNNTSTAAVNFQSATATSYTWTNNNTSIGLAASGTGNIPAFTATNTTATTASATITVTPLFNGCAGTATSFNINVKPTPVVSAIANQSVCNNTSTAAVNFTSTVSGTSFAWTNSNTAIGLGGIGSGNIGAFTATNTGTTDATGNFSVTPTANGCTGAAQNFTITVKPTPTVNQPANVTACNNAMTSVNFTAPIAGTVLNWTNSNTTIGVAASGSGNIAPFSAVNTGTTAVTSNLSVTPSLNGCTGSAMNFTITVNPSTLIGTHPTSVSVCTGSTATMTVVATGAGTLSYQWKKSGVDIAGANSATLSIPNATATDAGIYSVVVTGGCGSATSNNATLTVNTCTSVPQVDEEVTMSQLMPNRVMNETTLRIQVKRTMKISWSLVDASGKTLEVFTQDVFAGRNNDKTLSTIKFAKGIYYLRGTTTNGGVVTLKFIKL